MKNEQEIERFPGMIEKSAKLAAQDVTEDDMKAINAYTLTPLTADEVFTFKAVMCDNRLDRQFERFTVKALQDMKTLYLGKPVLKDHARRADAQVGRIYATDLEEDNSEMIEGEPYTKLVAKIYMVKTAGNSDLIAEIKGGIKKEGSVGFRASSAICSICGTDNIKAYCLHFPGETYRKDDGDHICTFTLAGVCDAYEFSIVAVPAQPAAGVSKSYAGEIVRPEEESEDGKVAETEENTEKEKELMLRARLAKIKMQNKKEKE